MGRADLVPRLESADARPARDHRKEPFLADATLYGPATVTGAEGEAALARIWRDGGPSGLAKANGDFALADWDETSATLTLGRDHVGVRPLFYVHRPGEFVAFASFATLLVDAGFASGEPDVETAALTARGKFAYGRRSFLSGVFRVPPAHVLEFRDGAMSERRYWRLTCENPISHKADFAATARELRSVLERAVNRRTAISGQIATHLSGGLDSQAVAVLAARDGANRTQQTVGYCFTAPSLPKSLHVIDEAPYASTAAQAEPGLSVQFVPSEDKAAAVLGPLAQEGPYSVAENDPYNRLLSDAAARDARTVLSGFGGDEMLSFNGLGVAAEQLVTLRWRRLWSFLSDRAAQTGRPMLAILAGSLENTILPPRLSSFLRGLAGKRRDGWDPFDRSLRTNDTWIRYKPDTRANRIGLVDGSHVEAVCDELAWRAARFGLAYAFPMLDREVLEFGIRLPSEFFVKNGETRAIFREAMRGVIAEAVRTESRKMPIDPTDGLSLGINKEQLQAALDRPAESERAAALFRFDVLKKQLDALPATEDRMAQMNREAAEGQIHNTRDALFSWQILLARYLAGQREASAELSEIRPLTDLDPEPAPRAAARRGPRRRRAR